MRYERNTGRFPALWLGGFIELGVNRVPFLGIHEESGT